MKSGFTILEVLVVVLILGVLILIAVMSFSSRLDENLLLNDFVTKFKNDLRYIRQQAIMKSKGLSYTYMIVFSYPTLTTIFTNYYYIDPVTNSYKDAYSSSVTSSGSELTQLKLERYINNPVRIRFFIDNSINPIQTNVVYLIFDTEGDFDVEPSANNSLTISFNLGTYTKNLFINPLGFITEVNP